MHSLCLLVLQIDKNTILYVVHIIIKTTFDAVKNNIMKSG